MSDLMSCAHPEACHALHRAELALSASSGLHVTDRPDLPREQWPVYVLDHASEIAGLQLARELICSGTGPGCGRGSADPSMEKP